MTIPVTGVLFYEPRAKPLSTTGAIQPGSYYQFYLTGTTTPANVYGDGALTSILSQTPGTGQTTAASDGRLIPIYLSPLITYRVQLYSAVGALLEDTDPFVPASATTPTQSVVGQILWPQTSAEIAAGVTPTNYAYEPLNPVRYGADGSGGGLDAAAFVSVNLVMAQFSTGVDDWKNGLSVIGYPKSVQEIAASIVPVTYWASPDGTQVLNVFRFMTPAQITDVRAGTAAVDVSAAIQAANDYVEGKAPGAIGTLASLVGGTGYNGGNPGTFNTVSLSGGHGSGATATVVVGASGAISSITIGYTVPGTWVGNPGTNYQVNDVLSLTSANMVAAGAVSGGSGSTTTVSTLASKGKTGTSITPGGTLFFPSGRYYCGTSGLRIGDMVRWTGTSVSGTTFKWSDSFNGNKITIGPGASGYNGRDGVYAMGAVLEHCTVQSSNGTGYGVYTTGLQQNGSIRDCWVQLGANSTGGVYLQDHVGSANMLCEDVYVFPPSGPVQANCVGFHLDGGANVELNRCSCNGGGGTLLIAGVAIAGAGACIKIKNFECELAATHIDISSGAGQGTVHVDIASLNLGGSPAGNQGIWVHPGWTGTLIATGVDTGPGEIAIRNDNTNESLSAAAGGGIFPLYMWSGTSTDVSTAQNFISVPPVQSLTVTSPGATVSPVTNLYQAYIYSINDNGGMTVAAPTTSTGGAPSATHIGHRLLFTIRNIFGSALGTTTWNGIFKMSTWTNPASGFSRSIEFEWNGTNWVQLWQATVDVPN